MKVSFLLRSTFSPSTIYIRVRTDYNDVRLATIYQVNPFNWTKGRVKLHNISRTVNSDTQLKRKENNKLRELQSNLDSLRELVLDNYLQNKVALNKDSLTKLLNPKPQPDTIKSYAETYFQLSSIRASTLKKVRSIVNRIIRYQDVRLVEVNKQFRKNLMQWLTAEGYAPNTISKTIKVLQTLCRHADDNGLKVHPEAIYIAKGLKYQRTPVVYLTETEIEMLDNVELPTPKLEIARDWLLISCYTGQRKGDLFNFTNKKITTIKDVKFLSVIQSKTSSPVMIPLRKPIQDILNKYKGAFPPLLANNLASHEVIYNRLIKKVAQFAGIDSEVEANLRNPKTKRYEILTVPKWKAVSSHIGRRSFASIHYGNIPTPVLMSITGHKSERQFLEYIGKPQINNALEAARLMLEYDMAN